MKRVPRTLADEILTVLDEPRSTDGPLTISHLSRRLGVSAALTRLCAKQLIADGSANAFMVLHDGAETIQGLSRASAPAIVAPVATTRRKTPKPVPVPAADADPAAVIAEPVLDAV